MRDEHSKPWTPRERLDLLVRAAEARIVAAELVLAGRERRAPRPSGEPLGHRPQWRVVGDVRLDRELGGGA